MAAVRIVGRTAEVSGPGIGRISPTGRTAPSGTSWSSMLALADRAWEEIRERLTDAA